MIFDLFSGGLGDFNLLGFIRDLLLSIPAFVLALSMHEAAHAFVADRCGDPTARLMGRLTLNPIKHIDPMGLLSVFLFRVGWAKPVPVNPNNFRNYRKDDLKVSLAGITSNLLMFIAGCVLMFIMLAVALGNIPADSWRDGYFLTTAAGGLVTVSGAFTYSYAMADILITPLLGSIWGSVYEMLVNFAVINLVLACFNLLPIPPLDGYHVFNDLILRRPLFAPQQVARVGQLAILVLAMTGLLSRGLNFIITHVFGGVGAAMNLLYMALFAA